MLTLSSARPYTNKNIGSNNDNANVPLSIAVRPLEIWTAKHFWCVVDIYTHPLKWAMWGQTISPWESSTFQGEQNKYIFFNILFAYAFVEVQLLHVKIPMQWPHQPSSDVPHFVGFRKQSTLVIGMTCYKRVKPHVSYILQHIPLASSIHVVLTPFQTLFRVQLKSTHVL